MSEDDDPTNVHLMHLKSLSMLSCFYSESSQASLRITALYVLSAPLSVRPRVSLTAEPDGPTIMAETLRCIHQDLLVLEWYETHAYWYSMLNCLT